MEVSDRVTEVIH